jgi:hypothetical protein
MECLSRIGPSKLVKCLRVRPGAYPTVEYLKGGVTQVGSVSAKFHLKFLLKNHPKFQLHFDFFKTLVSFYF